MSAQWKPKPTLAAILGIFFQPFTFLYTNSLKLFGLYFVLITLAACLDIVFGFYLVSVFSLICAIHGYRVAKAYDSTAIRQWYSRWWGILSMFVAPAIVIFLTRAFVGEAFQVPAGSMSPTINPGQTIVINKLGYGSYGAFGIPVLNTNISNPELMQRGEIYAFYLPEKEIMVIKRLIALPGDRIKTVSDGVYLNGKPLDRKIISRSNNITLVDESVGNKRYNIQQFVDKKHPYNKDIIIPEGQYFFLGDNRDNAYDSRIWGTVGGDRIVGKLAWVF